MLMPLSPVNLRLSVLAIFTVLVFGLSATSVLLGQTTVPSEKLLPANTKAWISVPDIEALKTAIDQTQFGKMMEDENVRPFVEDLNRQFRDWLNKKNIKFGMTVADIESVKSGEIAFAGVLQQPLTDATDAASQHAIVMMVDVKDSKDQAHELLKKVSNELKQRGATDEPIKVGDVNATKWSFKKPQGLREKQYAFHAVVGDWMLACDNETIFRDMIRRTTASEQSAAVLATNPTFVKINQSCQFEGKDYTAHLRWFVEPFGYIQLAQAIADAQNGQSERNDYAVMFQKEGFSAIKGLGGVVCVATGAHEAVHKTFIFAPAEIEGPEKYKRAAAMLDFDNVRSIPLAPPVWVPPDAASYLSFTWDLKKALEKIGYIIDSTAGTPGSWERTLEGFKIDPQGPQVDIRELVALLDNRISLATATELPITESSERILIGIKINDRQKFVAESVERLMPSHMETVPYGEQNLFVVDSAKLEEESLGDLEDDWLDNEFADDFGDEEETTESEEDQDLKRPKPLLAKRVFVVTKGFLLLGNDVEYMKKVIDSISQQPGRELEIAEDYKRVQASLEQLTGDSVACFRHFGRIDRSLQTNYEMMRQGKMAQSQTVLAQILNRVFTAEDAPDDFVRQQEIDGSKMPEDYEAQVAKYFGPTGLVIHTNEDGWTITGCLLQKKNDDDDQIDVAREGIRTIGK